MVTDDKEITITDLILFLKKYFLVIVFAPISISIISYYGSALLPKYYLSEISFFTNTGSSKSAAGIPAFVMGGMGNPLDSFKKNDSNFVDLSELLNSNRLLRSIAEKENIKEFYNTKTNKAAVGKLGKNLSYSIDEETSLEKLSFKSKDPIFTKSSTMNTKSAITSAIFQ